MLATVTRHGWEYTYGPVAAYLNETLPPAVLNLIEDISGALETHGIPTEYAQEMRGIARAAAAVGHGREFGLRTVVAVNLLYELTTACTSIVSETVNGQIYHSRNMDWSFGGNSMRNLTALVDFQRGGTTVYQTVTWLGYVGGLSAMRHTPGKGGWSVTVDERSTSDVLAPLEAVVRIWKGTATPIGMLVRDALTANADYTSAMAHLSTTPIANAVYYIVAGSKAGEGAVITRDANKTGVDVWALPNGPKPWFILETNYDHAKDPPKGDDRRDIATAAMERMGQGGISRDHLMGVMETPGTSSSRGVFNDITVYTIIMSATTGHFDGVTWR